MSVKLLISLQYINAIIKRIFATIGLFPLSQPCQSLKNWFTKPYWQIQIESYWRLTETAVPGLISSFPSYDSRCEWSQIIQEVLYQEFSTLVATYCTSVGMTEKLFKSIPYSYIIRHNNYHPIPYVQPQNIDLRSQSESRRESHACCSIIVGGLPCC